jgi:hypothetical protein
VGDNVTLTVTVTPDAPSALVPIGPIGILINQAKAQAGTNGPESPALPNVAPFRGVGGIIFSEGDTVLDTVPLGPAGTATWTPPTPLARGPHNITAAFTGTFGAMPSSDALLQVVQLGTTTVLNSSLTPTDFATPVTLTAKVASVAPDGSVPTGPVAFKDGATVIGSSPVDGTGTAVLVTSSLTVGTHTITAAYAGDGGNAASVSAPVTQVIKPAVAKSSGYWLAGADGGVFGFGSAPFLGSAVGIRPNQPVVGSVTTPDRKGYWLVSSDGGVFAFGNASYFGSLGGMKLNAPIVGMAPTTTGNGYWLFARDGGVFAFGDATYAGSLGRTVLRSPIVGGAAAKGGGYWLTAGDGGVFAFGGAPFRGSAAGLTLRAPVVGIASSIDGLGYWLVAADGGVFAYGTAPFKGSAAGVSLAKPVVGITRSQSGAGYWLTSADGGVFGYGDAPFFGSSRTVPLRTDVVGVMPSA